jgi:hypothetical protein
MTADLAEAVTQRLVDQGAVRHGRHLRFSCAAHRDRRPSADFEPERGVWVCRSCGVGGGVWDLARRLGIAPGGRAPRPTPPPRRPWRDTLLAPLLTRERRVQETLEPWIPVYRISDYLRTARQRIAEARALASAIGDTESVWRGLDVLATRERVVNAIEADLDGALRSF